MASIKQRKGSSLWVACYTMPDGSRKQVSTHTADEKQAMQIALGYERASGMAKEGRLNAATSKRVLGQIAAVSGCDIGGQVATVRQFLADQIKELKQVHGDRTLERYTYALQHYIDKSGLANEPIDNVTQANAANWRASLLAEGLSGTTVNHQLGTLRRAFGEALKREMITRNPFDGCNVKGTKKKKQRREAFTFDQFRDLVTALELADCPVAHADEWRLLVILAGYTGQRKSDCVQLKGSQVDLRGGVIRFWRSKNNDFHSVAIHPALARNISALVKKRGKLELFPNLSEYPRTGRGSTTDVFRQQVLPLIGIDQPYAEAKESRGRKIAPFSFHSLRHSLSSWLNAAGVSQVDRMALVGHEDSAVSNSYTHAGLENAQRAIKLIPAI